MMHKRVTGIVEDALSDHGKALAGGSSEHDSDVSVAYVGYTSDVRSADVEYVTADRRAVGEIELVRGCVDRIDFDCRSDIKTSGLKTKAKASGSGK